MKNKHRRYSGPKSVQFWDRVNALPEREKDVIYFAGVLLQELEARVLRELGQYEEEAQRKKESKRLGKP